MPHATCSLAADEDTHGRPRGQLGAMRDTGRAPPGGRTAVSRPAGHTLPARPLRKNRFTVAVSARVGSIAPSSCGTERACEGEAHAQGLR